MESLLLIPSFTLRCSFPAIPFHSLYLEVNYNYVFSSICTFTYHYMNIILLYDNLPPIYYSQLFIGKLIQIQSVVANHLVFLTD